ncbi:hypothetical protein NUU61_008112 [Penicillium alfredii]|uniref:UDP-N-acetylglucosamine transferase subunit ALG13 n=1 Tax=Penicillium alfredii TaxID=1506179 RepID=A0A9W9JZ34_9EURO|nr:uncharacterized protein NUU61_008112 [Penicillium alfredii]KAJ5086805.1 hypothetical protein NUU61_008112 [Penicillium alfredii]
MNSSAKSPTTKLCFVTVGATASFHGLLQQVLDLHFLATLSQFGYTHLLIQYGRDGRSVFETFLANNPSERHGIIVEGFDFNTAGLTKEMYRTRADHERGTGLVVSHAGTGTILEALRLGVRLVVVPNPDLADNHQEELATVLDKQNYVIRSSVQNVAKAIARAESKKYRSAGPSSQEAAYTSAALKDQLGFLD